MIDRSQHVCRESWFKPRQHFCPACRAETLAKKDWPTGLSTFMLGVPLGLIAGAALVVELITDPAEGPGYCEYPLDRLAMEYAHCTGDATPEGEGWVYRGAIIPGVRFYARYPRQESEQ